ncbi:hypothetical protein HFP57_17120 [Parasphingopyxis algicola]|uniref:TorF family putative porin n=1 Tax=Parasphingopyxis algicola TaxID=2026624 RepID=UPI0015A142A6|nr:TorF family putative porin [Parasphingopyxis algicola]QLC26586.1 hypothetical protein HFP57_17120 [Parasphingopyxis algicola]
MRTSIFGLALLATTAFAAPAHAGELGGGFSVSGNAALVTDYRFRGVSFSDEDIAIQGGIDLEHDSGFYVGTWASSIEDSPVFGHTELDIYAGWSGEITSGLTLDVGVLAYIYPNGNVGDADYVEPYASLSYTIGPAEITTGIAYAPSQTAIGDDDNTYVYGDISVGIPQTPITVSGHLGYTNGSLSIDNDVDYVDWSLGAEASFGMLSVGVAYVSTAVNGPLTDGTVVGTLGVSF